MDYRKHRSTFFGWSPLQIDQNMMPMTLMYLSLFPASRTVIWAPYKEHKIYYWCTLYEMWWNRSSRADRVNQEPKVWLKCWTTIEYKSMEFNTRETWYSQGSELPKCISSLSPTTDKLSSAHGVNESVDMLIKWLATHSTDSRNDKISPARWMFNILECLKTTRNTELTCWNVDFLVMISKHFGFISRYFSVDQLNTVARNAWNRERKIRFKT